MDHSNKTYASLGIALVAWMVLTAQPSYGQTIVYPTSSAFKTRLAAKEVRRYIYVRTGHTLEIGGANTLPGRGDLILVAESGDKDLVSMTGIPEDKLNPGAFIIKTVEQDARQILLIIGHDATATLHAAYRFAEHLGVGFDLTGDVIPDKKIPLDISGFDEQGKPLLAVRGILPFHDFPQGPDLWSTDEYLTVISQLPKLGMNFFGLHTYPLAGATVDKDNNAFTGPEPTVWVGLEQDVRPDGSVTWSYPAYWAHTHRPDRRWGYAQRTTGQFHVGASQLFEADAFGSDVFAKGMPSDVESSNEVFNRTGDLLKEAFGLAKRLGVKTAVGTELPMGLEPEGPEVDYDWIRGMPPGLQKRLISLGKDPEDPSTVRELYKGIFERIKRTHALDYYWLWSWEVWSMHGVSEKQIEAFKQEMQIAHQVLQEVNAPFQLGLAGWIIGTDDNPAEFDPTLPSDIPFYGLWDEGQGFEDLSSERVKWAATWLEEDWGLLQPQLEGHRIYADTKAALEKHCHGLIAKHWRTRVLSSNIGAMKNLLWGYGKTGQPLESKVPSNRNRWLDAHYLDWATRHFGPESARQIADIFTAFERKGKSGSGPMPHVLEWDSDFEDGGNSAPGAIAPNPEPWASEKERYDFVRRMEDLRPRIAGVGNLERFDYWLNVLKCYRLMGEYGTLRHQFEEAAHGEKWSQALTLRTRMARLFESIMTRQIQKASNASDLGEIMTLEILTWYQLMELKWDKRLKQGLGRDIPAESNPRMTYDGPPVIMVDAVRTSLLAGEPLRLRVRIVGEPKSVTLCYGPLGAKLKNKKRFTHEGRGVFSVMLPPPQNDFEYHIEANVSGGRIRYPVTAPAQCQTVIVME